MYTYMSYTMYNIVYLYMYYMYMHVYIYIYICFYVSLCI